MDIIGLYGHSEGEPGDEFVIVGGAVLDQPLLAGPVSQERVEDIQAFNWLQALAINGAQHPMQIQPGEDPPDRYVEAGGERWAVELTELTVEDFRGDLARMRRFGRDLEAELSQSGRHTHLRGRVVQVSDATQTHDSIPRDTGGLLSDALDVLAEDKGFLGEGADFSDGIPKQLPDRGRYGEVGPLSIDVGEHGRVGAITVASTPQAEIRHSEALAALEARVGDKDREPNQILIVSCGLPDERGYVCQVDNFLFQALWEARASQSPPGPLVPEPRVLDGVMLHQFGGNLLEVYKRPGAALPWSPTT